MMGNLGVWQLAIVAVIVLVLFGSKKLKTLGSDLGNSIKGFKSAMGEEPNSKEAQSEQQHLDK